MKKHIHIHVGKTKDGVTEAQNAVNKVKQCAAALRRVEDNLYVAEELEMDLQQIKSLCDKAIAQVKKLG